MAACLAGITFGTVGWGMVLLTAMSPLFAVLCVTQYAVRANRLASTT
jgi:hypothetical protein